MPELPEVETMRRDLAELIEGARIRRVRIRKPDIVCGGTAPERFARILCGRKIVAVDRRAKRLLFRLEVPLIVQVQVRMSGRFVVSKERPDPQEFGHVAAEFELEDGRTLYYDDVRRLGGFSLLRPEEWEAIEGELGPEPLSTGFSARTMMSIFSGRRAPIKSVLMDQRRIAGVGNIYACEALHRAGLDPRRAAGRLTADETRRLHRALRRILRDALREAGTTFRDYRAVNGRSGNFQRRLRVYARAGEPCLRCGIAVERRVQAGRSTFFCPGCQH